MQVLIRKTITRLYDTMIDIQTSETLILIEDIYHLKKIFMEILISIQTAFLIHGYRLQHSFFNWRIQHSQTDG